MDSISFDRAADFYDRTRALPEDVGTEVIDALVRLMSGQGRVLEIGIGTGRIALPLAQRGIPVYGVDLALPMLRRLQEKTDNKDGYPALAAGDASLLPFASSSFQTMVAVHVFHLVGPWKRALQESRRVLGQGGSLYIGRTLREANSIEANARAYWRQVVQSITGKPDQPGVFDQGRLMSYAESLGARTEEHIAGTWIERRSLAEWMEGLSQRIWSSTWGLSDEHLARAIERMVEKAEREWGSLDSEIQFNRSFVWHVIRW